MNHTQLQYIYLYNNSKNIGFLFTLMLTYYIPKIVIVNNFTNIKKTNIHLYSSTKMTTIYGIGNTGPCLGQGQQFGAVKPVNGIPAILW